MTSDTGATVPPVPDHPLWKRVAIGAPDECWPWTGLRSAKGYGRVWIGGRIQRAHRVALVLDGRDPGALHGLHECDNPSCCNPRHLFVGSNADNMRDRQRKGRTRRGERHGCAKLTAAQVDELRAAYAAGGVTQAALGRRYGVGQDQISRIVNGERWK